jgi:hypothetical protein
MTYKIMTHDEYETYLTSRQMTRIYVLEFTVADGELMTLYFDNDEAFDKAEKALQVEIGNGNEQIKSRHYTSGSRFVRRNCDDETLDLIKNPLY